MLTLVILLVLAFAIGSVIKTLGTGTFLASLIGSKVSGAFGPAIIFILGAVMSFSTGTSWGTFSIMMPIAIPGKGGHGVDTHGVHDGLHSDLAQLHCGLPVSYTHLDVYKRQV